MARSGGVCGRSIASVSAVLVAGSRRRLRRRRARVVVLAMSGDVLVARACSTASQGDQGVLVVVTRHVASVCPRRAHALDASGVQGAMDACWSGQCRAPPRQRPVLGDSVE
jgi:CTP:molybdopterin cytidylyltransferase MocA